MSSIHRKQRGQPTVVSVLAGFIVAALFGPPDPFSQLRIVVGILVVSLGVSYWLSYKTRIELPVISWGDLFRGIVTTFLFWVLISLSIAVVTTVDEGSAASVFQFSILVISAVIAAIVISSDRIPWPGDE